jgi:hypothetical protein
MIPAFDFDPPVGGPVLPPPIEFPSAPPQLTTLTTPLTEATVGLLVTCGVYYPDQPAPRQHGDLSYRLLPRDRGLGDVQIAHRTPIRAFAMAEPSVAYPLQAMLDLEGDGVIARLADNAVSASSATQCTTLAGAATASRIVEEFRSMGVNLVLAMPFCPQCHILAGVLARAIELHGLPTTSLTTLRRQACAVKPPRATFLDFPPGCAGSRPRVHVQPREILRQALETGVVVTANDPWQLHRLLAHRDENGSATWERLVTDLYRLDNKIRGTSGAATNTHGGQPVGRSTDFTMRNAPCALTPERRSP